MDRGKRLESTTTYAHGIAALFRPEAANEGPSCLLEQCARHILTGVGVAAQRSAQGLKSPIPLVSRDGPGGRPPAGAISGACEAIVSSGPRPVLATCSQTAELIKTLQEHYTRKVKPLLAKVRVIASD